MYKKIFRNFVGNDQDTRETEQLHKRPSPESQYNDMPHFNDFKVGQTCQADLLYLPDDRGYKYLLVVVDDASRQMDGEPLKERSDTDIIKGFEKIFKRKLIKKPKFIEVDSGSEFKGKTKSYFDNMGIGIRYAETARHRQQGLVEVKNHIIGKIVFLLQNHKEKQSGKQNKEWINEIKKIINDINSYSKEGLENEQKKHPLTDFPVWTDANKNLLKEGTTVRVELNHPVEVYKNKRLNLELVISDGLKKYLKLKKYCYDQMNHLCIQ